MSAYENLAKLFGLPRLLCVLRLFMELTERYIFVLPLFCELGLEYIDFRLNKLFKVSISGETHLARVKKILGRLGTSVAA